MLLKILREKIGERQKKSGRLVYTQMILPCIPALFQTKMPKIIECVPNFSEGINEKVISAISGLVFVGFSLIGLIMTCKLAGLINLRILQCKVLQEKKIQIKVMAK